MTSDRSRPRRRRWPLLLAVAVLAAVIATVAVRQAGEPAPITTASPDSAKPWSSRG